MVVIVPQANVRGGAASTAAQRQADVERNYREAIAIVDRTYGMSKPDADAMIRQQAPNIGVATQNVISDQGLAQGIAEAARRRDDEQMRFNDFLKRNTEAIGPRLGDVRAYGNERIQLAFDARRKVAIQRAWERQRNAKRLGPNER